MAEYLSDGTWVRCDDEANRRRVRGRPRRGRPGYFTPSVHCKESGCGYFSEFSKDGIVRTVCTYDNYRTVKMHYEASQIAFDPPKRRPEVVRDRGFSETLDEIIMELESIGTDG
ncbi:MAG: hypothetical protein QXU82_02520 [Candidatus Aenigmatarchaeota archaeon]